MTFSRTPRTPINFLAYSSTNPLGESVLQVQIGSGVVQLPKEDALALSEYIQEKFA